VAEDPPGPIRHQASVAPLVPPGPTVTIRYRSGSAILVRGPVTGRQYRFSPERAVQAVDARDVEALLRTRVFVRTP
jgi:hypothetical protein